MERADERFLFTSCNASTKNEQVSEAHFIVLNEISNRFKNMYKGKRKSIFVQKLLQFYFL